MLISFAPFDETIDTGSCEGGRGYSRAFLAGPGAGLFSTSYGLNGTGH
jgi:hypothetical protein